MLQLFQMLGFLSSSGGGSPSGPTTVTPSSRRITFSGTAIAAVGTTLPEGTRAFAEAVDPYDILDFEIDISGLLEPDEALSSAVLVLPTESVLLGLTINTTGGYSTTLTGNILKFYMSIADQDQNNKAFTTGIYLPIELRIITTSVPARRKQRTVAVRVVQR